MFQDLLKTLKSDELLPYGSQFEVEIRGCSIHAVELIVQEIRKRNTAGKSETEINSILVDYFLWGFRRELAEEMTKHPYHKTRSIYY